MEPIDTLTAIQRADVVLVGGTSLSVHPAAGLLRYYRGHRLALVNLDETPMDDRADLVINSRIDEVVAEVCRRLFAESPDSWRSTDQLGC